MTDFNQQQIMENSPELLAEFLSSIDANDNLGFLQECQEAEIANILESVNVPHRRTIIEALPAEKYWTILNFLQFETARHIHASLSEELANERLSCITESDVVTFADQ
jgi:Mg/Co/Ni transporter MgtE